MNASSYCLRTAALSCVALVLSSCGSNDGKVAVTGSVTWNGTAIPEGDILFFRENDLTIGDRGRIVGGKYSVETQPGKKTVQIYYSREGKYVPEMGAKMREQVIPKEYNDESQLKIEVQESGERKFDFNLPLDSTKQ